MHAFDILGDPVRRRILELLAGGAHASGDIVAVIQREFSHDVYHVADAPLGRGRRLAESVSTLLGSTARGARHRNRPR